METLKDTIYDCFSIIDDPRAANAQYSLGEILFCLIVGVTCGGDGLVGAAHVAKKRRKFIEKFVPLPNGVPSHDTMGKLLAVLDPDQFVDAFATLMERLTGKPKKDIINLDGKSLKGVVGAKQTRDPEAVAEQAHIVSAYSAIRRIVLGQLRSKQVANEVQAAQELLMILDVHGSIITTDAAHTNHRTLQIISERGADAVVAVKANTPGLAKDIEKAFRMKKPKLLRTKERTHGKTETRKYEFVPASGDGVENDFKTLKVFVRVSRDNVSHAAKQQRADAEVYYAATFDDVELVAKCIRARWAIENSLHWVLDVEFNEDRSRIRTKNAAENFSRLRHIAYGLLSLKKTPKLSFALKRMSAAMDDRYLASVLRLKTA
jgi:predicted transposase YbfD/YdcC